MGLSLLISNFRSFWYKVQEVTELRNHHPPIGQFLGLPGQGVERILDGSKIQDYTPNLIVLPFDLRQSVKEPFHST